MAKAMPVVSVARQCRGAQNTPESRLNSRGALDRLRIGCMELNRQCVLSHTARRGRGRCTPSDVRRLGGRFAHDQRVSEEDHCQHADRAFRNCMRARGREVDPGPTPSRTSSESWRRRLFACWPGHLTRSTPCRGSVPRSLLGPSCLSRHSACVASHTLGDISRTSTHVPGDRRHAVWSAGCTRSGRCDDTLDGTATLNELLHRVHACT